MKSLVIIPTYNEKENISKLIEAVIGEKISGLDILVVDDNSPDKTAEAVESLKPACPGLHLIKRPGKLGLGSAYTAGFGWALDRGYELIIEMDADFSHDPKALKSLLDAADKYDLVIGSRYVKNGRVENWPLIRKIVSRGGSLYSRLILGVNIRDFTGGYNAWRASVLKGMDFKKIHSNGYSFQVEIKYRAIKNGAAFCEIPIVFREREQGKSKMSKKIFLEAVWKVVWLRLAHALRPARTKG